MENNSDNPFDVTTWLSTTAILKQVFLTSALTDCWLTYFAGDLREDLWTFSLKLTVPSNSGTPAKTSARDKGFWTRRLALVMQGISVKLLYMHEQRHNPLNVMWLWSLVCSICFSVLTVVKFLWEGVRMKASWESVTKRYLHSPCYGTPLWLPLRL